MPPHEATDNYPLGCVAEQKTSNARKHDLRSKSGNLTPYTADPGIRWLADAFRNRHKLLEHQSSVAFLEQKGAYTRYKRYRWMMLNRPLGRRVNCSALFGLSYIFAPCARSNSTFSCSSL